MNLFDALSGQAASVLPGLAGNLPPGLMNEVGQLLGSNGGQGLASLVTQLQGGGLGPAVASWIGTGANHAVSGDQLQAALGSGAVGAIAQKLGLPQDQIAGALAQVLPHVVNHLTPNGQLPSQDLLQQGLAMLKSLG